MAKPKAERPTTNPFGMRVNHVLLEKNLLGDYAHLAAMFDVKVPSVYGWIDTGRIHKSKLTKLVEWSGYPHAWWLDTGPISQPLATSATAPFVQAESAVYQMTPRPPLDMATLLIALGTRMRGLDPPLRSAIGEIINGMCRDPETSPSAINRVTALLATEGNNAAQRYTNSQAAQR